jgi:hypothetical protein
MAKPKVTGSGTKQSPWLLKTPSGSSDYQMYKDESLDPPALVCTVGKRSSGTTCGVWTTCMPC